jgi:hypothetical protein
MGELRPLADFGLQGVAEILPIFFHIPNKIWNMDVEHFAVSTLDGLDVLLFMAVGWCYAPCE